MITVFRATINLGNLELDVFRLPDGSYRLSESGCEQAVGKPRKSTANFLRSKSPYALPHKGFHTDKLAVFDEPMRINGIPFEIAAAFWTKEAMSGNLLATALLAAFAVEGLERRANAAFEVQKTEGEYNQDFADFLARWHPVRDELRASHLPFMNAYEKRHHPGAQLHDHMTMLIWNETAAIARLKQLVDPECDPRIGLNHQDDIPKMVVLTNAKLIYAGFRRKNESWEDQGNRAVALALQ